MWDRTNMASSPTLTLPLLLLSPLLLLGCICIFAEAGTNDGTAATKALQQSMLERAEAWLWSERDREAGWGNETQRVLLALRLTQLSRDVDEAPPASLDMQLSAKRLELEIVLQLWRHRDIGGSPLRLARYTIALNAMCMDPRQFYGHDLIGTLQHRETPTDYEFTLSALAACNAQAHVRKRQMRRLLDIAHTAQDHTIDTVAMCIMTLRCIVQDHRHRNLQHFVRKPSLNLAQRQLRDGSFGDLRSTALAVQALEEVENEPLNNWNKTAAINWLSRRQRDDGSFEGDLRNTAEVVVALAPRKLSSIRMLDCGEELAGNGQVTKIIGINGGETSQPTNSQYVPSSTGLPTSSPHQSTVIPSVSSDFFSTAINKEATVTSSYVITRPQNPLVNVTYTLWVGSDVNEIHNLSLQAPKNETFYEVMVLAAQRSTDFTFSAYEWPNGHYVHTLAGYKEEPMSYHYWLLYRLPSPPEPSSPPGNQLVAPGGNNFKIILVKCSNLKSIFSITGVDDLQISDGEHYLFWYKKL
uniref:Uncharacterized protein n=1 Tax=Trichogramma kaykai TaxID=54128 RepID=A0ABD2WGG0_9HYME